MCIVFVSFKIQKGKTRNGEGKKLQKVANGGFRERTSSLSLEYRAIRLSAVFGKRRKAALRGAGYVWTPDLRIFDKLREVGVSPYWGFILYLSTLLMFELNEAVKGRLIGPKSWDRIVIIFETQMVQPVTIHG